MSSASDAPSQPQAQDALATMLIMALLRSGAASRSLGLEPGPAIVTMVVMEGSGDPNAFSEKPGQLPASKESIDAMPRITVTENVKDCAICLEDIGVGSEAREMPCKHGFHSGCIEKWLGIHGSCPVCRFVMPVEEKERGGGDGRVERTVVSLVFTVGGPRTDSDLGRGSEDSNSGSSEDQNGAGAVDDSSTAEDMEY